ncbi:hypothetical protein Prudu_417S000100, partial [Prunus dulcis]
MDFRLPLEQNIIKWMNFGVIPVAGRGDIGRLKDKRGIGSKDSYRVLLVDDVRHTEKLGLGRHTGYPSCKLAKSGDYDQPVPPADSSMTPSQLESLCKMQATVIVEALICSQNWLRSDDISSLQYEPTIQEMEFYESIELDIMSSSTPSTIAPTTFQFLEENDLAIALYSCNFCKPHGPNQIRDCTYSGEKLTGP